ncbi:hypothetical protein F5B18DRAFT_635346 [Nemania serpens]|nr:hypothetical protein F5B18DRAFT_635346 [Nemania serpens]
MPEDAWSADDTPSSDNPYISTDKSPKRAEDVQTKETKHGVHVSDENPKFTPEKIRVLERYNVWTSRGIIQRENARQFGGRMAKSKGEDTSI